jgi:hypothetical protein
VPCRHGNLGRLKIHALGRAEVDLLRHSYGFRPGRGCKDALRRVDGLLKAGYRYVVDADLKSYFDTIPHDKLMKRVREHVADGRVLKLIESFLEANIMEGLKEWTPTAGAPQGAVLSPLLSNIYLNPLDHLMARRGMEMVRYADDFVILCRTREEAQVADRAHPACPQKLSRAPARSSARWGFDTAGARLTISAPPSIKSMATGLVARLVRARP